MTITNSAILPDVVVSNSLPDFDVRKTRKNHTIYNMRIAMDLPGEGTYRRVAQPLRKTSKILDVIEFMDKGSSAKAPEELYLQGNTRQFIEDLIVSAVEKFIPVTNITRLNAANGIEVWAAYDRSTVSRVKGKYGETLKFGIAPIVAQRLTGTTLRRAKKMLAKINAKKRRK